MVSTHFFSVRGPRFESGHFWFYFFVNFCPKFLLRQEFRQRFLGSLWSKLMASMVKSRLQKLLCEMAFKSLWKRQDTSWSKKHIGSNLYQVWKKGIDWTPFIISSFRVYRIVGCHRSSKGVSCGRLLARWRRPRIIIIFSHSNHRFKLLAID